MPRQSKNRKQGKAKLRQSNRDRKRKAKRYIRDWNKKSNLHVPTQKEIDEILIG